MKRLLTAAILVLLGSLGVCAQTTVSDNLAEVNSYTAGTVTQVRIGWPAFTTADNLTNVAAGNITLPITSNGLYYSMQPNAGVSGVYYTFTFTVGTTNAGGVTTNQLYSLRAVIPVSATPVTLLQCAISSAPWWGGTGSTGGGSGGNSGNPPPNTNALSLNGVSLSGTPTDGQAYVFSASSNAFVPVAVPYWRKFSVAYSQLISFNAATGTITLEARANRQKVCGVSEYVTGSFVAPGLTHLNITVGDSNSTTNLYTPIALDGIDNGGADANVLGSAVGSSNITATFSATGANLNTLTNGAVDLDVCLVQQP